jgi:hypothetical protein
MTFRAIQTEPTVPKAGLAGLTGLEPKSKPQDREHKQPRLFADRALGCILLSAMKILFEKLRYPLYCWGNSQVVYCLLPRGILVHKGQEFRLGNQGSWVIVSATETSSFFEHVSSWRITMLKVETVVSSKDGRHPCIHDRDISVTCPTGSAPGAPAYQNPPRRKS